MTLVAESMALTMDHIKQPVAVELEAFEGHFREAMRSHVPLLDKIMYYIIRRKGKRVRPMFVFLCARICGNVNESTYRAASLIELLHTATLVHDDVVDDSNMRRGFFSINALWKNKAAVLVGDYLLTQGLLLALDNNEHNLLTIYSRAVREMIEGELLQLDKARRLDIEEPVYFEIIRQKTATLIAACCAIGAASVNAGEEEIKQMHKFGELIGIAFQIKDDLFDYTEEKIGKPTGIDIKERKMTLPLIYSLNNSPSKEKRWLINSIKNHNKDKKRVKEVIAFVKQQGGIEYAVSKMHEYKEKALDILHQYPESNYKSSLIEMVNYVIERKI